MLMLIAFYSLFESLDSLSTVKAYPNWAHDLLRHIHVESMLDIPSPSSPGQTELRLKWD